MKYNYKLVRSNRKTLSVGISSDNVITVRAPYGVAIGRIELFLERKSRWIDKKISDNALIISKNAEVTNFSAVPVFGENVPLVLGRGNLGFKDGKLYADKLSSLKKIYIDCFGGGFIERFNDISNRAGLNARSVGFRSYKSRWGCCDGSGNIVFNYKILMLPKDLQDYVIIHELCHTKFMDHSQKFWNEAQKLMPNCKIRRRELKNYAYLTRLYP